LLSLTPLDAQLPIGAQATVQAWGEVPALQSGTEVSFDVTSGPDAGAKAVVVKAEPALNPDQVTCLPAATFSFDHKGDKPGTDTVTATVVGDPSVSGTGSVSWAYPVPAVNCHEGVAELGYLQALQCQFAAAKPLVHTVLDMVSCFIGIAGFFVPAGKVADLLNDASKVINATQQASAQLAQLHSAFKAGDQFSAAGPALQLALDLAQLNQDDDHSLAVPLATLEAARTLPDFLHGIAAIISGLLDNHDHELAKLALKIGKEVPGLVANFVGLESCVDLLGKIIGSQSALPPVPQLTWTERAIASPEGPFSLGMLSCASASFCLLLGRGIGGTERTDFSIFNGRVWSNAATVPGSQDLSPSSVSCPALGYCIGLFVQTDMNHAVLTYEHAKWSLPTPLPPAQGTATLLSCATTTFCMVVGDGPSGGVVWQFNGWTWSQSLLTNWVGTDLSFGPISLSCPITGFCVVVGWSNPYPGSEGAPTPGYAVGYLGGIWGAPESVEPNPLVTVSCAGSRFCAAVDGYGKSVVYDGSNWSSPVDADPGYCASLGGDCSSVSCPAPGSCVLAYGGNGTTAILGGGEARISTYGQGSWSTPQVFSNVLPLISISCPTTTFCAALSATADSLIGRGT
jgi:hypothetical protein